MATADTEVGFRGATGPGLRTAALTGAALAGFAANSLLGRSALSTGGTGAVAFTAVRLGAGAAALAVLVRFGRSGREREREREGSWRAAAALFAYAAAFSFAFLRLSAGTGALVLFAAVQVTMIGGGRLAGHRPRAREWVGLALAAAGIVFLVLPGLTRPDPAGLALMALAGIGWGAYSLIGRGARRPLLATADNFLRTVPAAAVAVAVAFAAGGPSMTARGFALASASGALASGLGYALWYAALPGLTPSRAAIVQLLVPVLAALGGVALLGEAVTARLLVAGVAIATGVAVCYSGTPFVTFLPFLPLGRRGGSRRCRRSRG